MKTKEGKKNYSQHNAVPTLKDDIHLKSEYNRSVDTGVRGNFPPSLKENGGVEK